ncbi:NUDIX domain-containing protein [Nocardioides sp.]|uniref:NUDIX hydrolase n=1 Tax=Nocardioides sp. TaxID=35761 RepID=UPI0027236297|nr:NUDIX domain-containing protein [Nocardioides sp.]MDO9455990.1 NUDIX domain-containing protein [Nocardioides sp.]
MPRHPVSYVAVDVAAFTIADDELVVLVVERGVGPFRGALALPGGFVLPDETLEEAARRELREETGVDEPVLEQLRSYGAPARDPRARTVSVAHLAVLSEPVSPVAGTDAASAAWRAVADVRRAGLAFDHEEILDDAVERLASKLEYTAVATAFLAEEFTLAELRSVYEVVWGRPLDAGNFQRKVRASLDWVEPTGELRAAGRGRPASLFRPVKSGTAALDSPLVRSSW